MKSSNLQQQVEAQILSSYSSLYRLAFVYVKNPDDAMDVVQESVYRAIHGALGVRNADAIGSWLRRIVVNTALDFLRQRSRETPSDHLPETGCWEDRYPDVDVLSALDILDLRERSVVVLRFFEDQKLQDIAGILEENENTVKTILYRSLKKLKIELTKGESNRERKPSGRTETGI
ncbi:MAG: RNA polymerase sigma factor [Oscillospiraceae bacterium]|nr:RNA polymerase sigma factor [Oscillospiraceae bacterium]